MPDENAEDLRKKLQATLDELHGELGQVESLDPAVRRELEVAADEILQVLARPERERDAEAEVHADSLVERLREATDRFEESHPTLTGIVGSVIDTISRMGI